MLKMSNIKHSKCVYCGKALTPKRRSELVINLCLDCTGEDKALD